MSPTKEKKKRSVAPSKSSGDLKQLLDVIERAKYEWESTFDAIVNPVMIVDPDYRIQRANLAFGSAAESDVRDLIGKVCYRSFAGRESPCPGCPFLLSVSSGLPASSGVEKFPDGRQYQASSFPLQGKKSDLNLFIVQYRDCREERHLQARLIQSEKMAAVGLLAGGIAHEINNPLSGILAFAQLALRQTEEGSQLQEDIREIETSALRCKKIVENLLEFSRQSSPEERSEQDLNELFTRILPLLKIQVKETGASLTTNFGASLPKILANGNQLEQVFLNLTSNACHALNQGGNIQISASQGEGGWVRIDFCDNGCGIKKEHLSKIFDPFFTTKQAGMGTGLGLSITYSIVQDHGGRIEVDSRESEGTTFRIYLPAISEMSSQVQSR